MFPDDQFRMTRQAALALAISSAFAGSAWGAAAGRVDFAAGNVSATSADGSQRNVSKGASVAEGDTLVTKDGRAQVRLSDGGFVSIQPNSQFKLDQYRYSGQADGSEKSFFSLLKGALRTVTGAIGKVNRGNYRVETAAATIGIRGTEFLLSTDGTSTTVFVGAGEVEGCNATGCYTAGGNQGLFFPSANAPGQKTDSPPQVSGGGGGEGEQQQGEGFRSGEQRNEDGTLAAIGVGRLTGTGPFFTAFAHSGGQFNNSGGAGVIDGFANGSTATLNAAGVLISFTDGAEGFSSVTIGSNGVLIDQGPQDAAIPVSGNDGIVAWGAWAGGQTGGDHPFLSELDSSLLSLEGGPLAYVVGVGTSQAELNALQTANLVGTYSLMGGPRPYGSSCECFGELQSGSMTVFFGEGIVHAGLAFNVDGNDYNLNANVSLNSNGGGHLPSFSGSGNFTSDSSSSYSTSVGGIISGQNGARAGLSYKVDNTPAGDITGGAVYKQTTLGPDNVP